MKAVVDIKLTPLQLAEAFCEMNDEQQAQVFIEMAEIAKSWTNTYGGAGWQWWSVGRHLLTCGCSTEAARELVREIAAGTHGET